MTAKSYFTRAPLPWLILAFSVALNAYQYASIGTHHTESGLENVSEATHNFAKELVDNWQLQASEDIEEGGSEDVSEDRDLGRSEQGFLLSRWRLFKMGHTRGQKRRNLFSRRLADTSHGTETHVNETGHEAATCHTDGHGEHDIHQHDALTYLFFAVFVGVCIMHVRSYLTWMQETVCFFVVGMFLSFVVKWIDFKDPVNPEYPDCNPHANKFTESYYMWMDIDPHLLLFTLLPPLLAGDAMNIDTSVAQHVGFQCLYMAGPGVMVNAFAVAGFLSWYLDWSLKLSLLTGSILCATDPVAVVALLKELGASPTLTVQIQGESLLNDGTAIVLFTVCYNMVSGEEYDFAEVVMFLVQVAIMAWGLGMFIGYIFFSWIRATGNIFIHHSSIIQIALTLTASYWSFVVAEGLLGISGVLSTVACSLVLAHNMWPHCVAAKTMHDVWHTFEALGNIIIFFLAGSLTGKVMTETPAEEFLRLLVVYVVLIVVRTTFIFSSRPILKCLSLHGTGVSWEDAAVMSWGGLRGAVGLALAIQVFNDRAPNDDDEPQIDEDTARQVYFLVGGIALLTTIINATTAPLLVKWLGITATPQAQLRLLKIFFKHIMEASGSKSNNPPQITEGLNHMLEEMEKEIEGQKVKKSNTSRLDWSLPKVSPSGEKSGEASVELPNHKDSAGSINDDIEGAASVAMEESASIIGKLRKGEEMYRKVQVRNPNSMLWVKNTGGEVSRGVPVDPDDNADASHSLNLLCKVDGMVRLVTNTDMDEGMAQVVNRTFLSLVNKHYWRQIECRDLRPGSEEAKILLTSIQVGLSTHRAYGGDLNDFNFVVQQLRKAEFVKTWWNPDEDDEEVPDAPGLETTPSVRSYGDDLLLSREVKPLAAEDHQGVDEKKKVSLAKRIVASGPFNIYMAKSIVANGVQVALEFNLRDEDDNGIGWLITEGYFTVLFFFEFVIKFAALGRKYFKSGNNVFDFVLVVLGILGFALTMVEFIADSGDDDGSSLGGWSALIRISRVFRILRFLRLLRLFHAKLGADKEVSVELAASMLRISTFLSFIGAQLAGQMALVKYFGKNGVIDQTDEAEIARCIIQSQVNVYKAIQLTVVEEKRLSDKELLADLKWAYERKEITEGLEEFVMEAYNDGAITAKEAESIVHPLHNQIKECLAEFHSSVQGIAKRHQSGIHTPQSSPHGASDGRKKLQEASTATSIGKSALDGDELQKKPSGGEQDASRGSDESAATTVTGNMQNSQAAGTSARQSSDPSMMVADLPCIVRDIRDQEA